MSAYMVNREHIRYLITAAKNITNVFRWYYKDECNELLRDDRETATKTGQMLWDANMESIVARYPGTKPDNVPGMIGETYIYVHNRDYHGEIDPVQVIKACDCFDYQACEYDDWKKSNAKAFIDSLRSDAWHNLPGYDAAEWGSPKELVFK